MNFAQRYFIEFAYDGLNYHGWQKQPDAVTVQEKLEEGLSLLLRQKIVTTGAGRTDAGVHAKQMYAHFDLDSKIHLKNITFRLNRWLPQDISIFSVFSVAEEDHTRFHAVSRSYEYHFHLRPDPFHNKTSYILHRKPDFKLMDKAAKVLLDYSNFQCFSRSKTQVITYICDITEARFEFDGYHVVFHITADRFLRNMVRAIVGTLLEIGYRKNTIEGMHTIIKSKNRSAAGASAPARGLYLTKVTYPESVLKNRNETF
ncbi:MAG: tRNA pseudouridine(38-40) synthase TruA [Nonlabens sp.]